MHIQNTSDGFTLIELSIVIFVIGLIVGGVVVGTNLIKAAEIRATISQIEKYNQAVNTFRTKYNGIPGDLTAASAAAFGFTSRNGSRARGNGDERIEATTTFSGGVEQEPGMFGQEPGMFWNDLSVAKLVDGNFTGSTNQDSADPLSVTAAQVPLTFPAAKIRGGAYVTVGGTGGGAFFIEAPRGVNYYMITGIVSVDGGGGFGGGMYNYNPKITPVEAYTMDLKIDDGRPLQGRVQTKSSGAIGGTSSTTALFSNNPEWQSPVLQSGVCTTGGASASDRNSIYNINPGTYGNNVACNPRFRFQ